MSNQFYKNINRPFADIDFTQVKSWNLVMCMMESQAIAAEAQINAKYQQSQSLLSNDMLPVHLTNAYKDNKFNYVHSNGEESDNSSYYSDEEMSSNKTSTTVNTTDNIPTTVINLEEQIRERTNQPKKTGTSRSSSWFKDAQQMIQSVNTVHKFNNKQNRFNK